VAAGHRVRWFTVADLVEHLYRALADNTVGKTIETLLRHDPSDQSLMSAARQDGIHDHDGGGSLCPGP